MKFIMINILIYINKIKFFFLIFLLCYVGSLYAEPVDLIVPPKIKKNENNIIDQKLLKNNQKEETLDEESEISITTLKPIDPSSVGI